MLDSLNMLSKQVREIWRQFGVPQRVSVAMSLMAAVAILGTLLYWSARPDYRVLYSNLSLEDASKMREKLDESKIPVRLGQSGMSISVPAGNLYSARLLLAADGLPGDSSTGFELFEQPKFGLTDFAQKVNYQRALQGELERTISSMQGIRSVRVMLVLPKDGLFVSDEERKAQASVLLNMNGSIVMGDGQVQSIVHLLASSVQGLAPEKVTVTDETGRLLTRSRTADDVLGSGSEQFDVQERTEKRLVAKAQDILDQALGVGNSIVRVSVDLNFSDIEERDETYDAENRVATSERIISESKSSGKGAGGRAGVVANVSVGDPSNMKVDTNAGKDKSEELINEYAIPTKVTVTRQKGVTVQQLTVAVALAQGEVPRTKEQIALISALIANALGVDSSRGDDIQVSELQFVVPQPPAEPTWFEKMPIDYDSIFKGLGGIVALTVVFGASRKVKALLVANNPALEEPINAAHEQEQEHLLKDHPPQTTGDQMDMVSRMARENPKMVAAWITNAANWNG